MLDPITELPDDLQPHPLALQFRPFTDDEFADLVADITANGQHLPIMLYEGKVLDGWHRYQACIKAGVRPRGEQYTGSDPAAYVRSVNAHRRHLTLAERRAAITQVLKENPELSNRQIADQVKVSHPTVAKARKKMEQAGDVVKVSTSIDTKNRKQPAHKKTRAKPLRPKTPTEEITGVREPKADAPIRLDPHDRFRHDQDRLV